jgi:polysaccharide export outer membrane protein
LAICTGCQSRQLFAPGWDANLPRELDKVSMPAYIIEPPDILALDAVRVVPKPPYRIEPLDVLILDVSGGPKEVLGINGLVPVDSDGTLTLGADYGQVRVVGMTLEEARLAVEKHLATVGGIKAPRVALAVAQSRGLQQIRGEHLVQPDGTVSLGTYGRVYITGKTVPEARAAIEEHLTEFMVKPEISVDILAYNSKVFYLITDGGGFGQQIIRLPITGNDTVLDAVAQINGLPSQSSKRHIWVARPAPARHNGTVCKNGEGDQILPVDWRAITECGRTETNWQLMPGDRLYVKADSLVTLDNALAKIITPIERLFGVTLLGSETIQNLRGGNRTGNGVGGTGF